MSAPATAGGDREITLKPKAIKAHPGLESTMLPYPQMPMYTHYTSPKNPIGVTPFQPTGEQAKQYIVTPLQQLLIMNSLSLSLLQAVPSSQCPSARKAAAPLPLAANQMMHKCRRTSNRRTSNRSHHRHISWMEAEACQREVWSVHQSSRALVWVPYLTSMCQLQQRSARSNRASATIPSIMHCAVPQMWEVSRQTWWKLFFCILLLLFNCELLLALCASVDI